MMPRLKRFLAVTCLALGTLLLGGCVYLRLLQLKFQLADFDRNFAVDTRDGLALTFQHPVLLDQDVESFFRWVPDTRQRIGTAEKWHFAWIKERVADDADKPPVEITLDLLFVNHELVKITAPENFFAATMPKSLALAALRSLGHANVDRDKRRADSTIDGKDLQNAAADQFLTEAGLLTALGEPGTKTLTNGAAEWRYQFVPASAHQRFGDNGVVDVTFTLDSVTHKVRLMKGKTVFGSIVFDATHTGPNIKGSMSAALPK